MPNHPEHSTMLRPTSKDKEHALLNIAFMQTGCRKTIIRYRGKQSYCPRCGSRYSPPQVKDLRHQLYGEGFHAWVAYLRVACRLSCRLVAKLTRDVFHEEISIQTLNSFLSKPLTYTDRPRNYCLREFYKAQQFTWMKRRSVYWECTSKFGSSRMEDM